jgi:hypothetical protein
MLTFAPSLIICLLGLFLIGAGYYLSIQSLLSINFSSTMPIFRFLFALAFSGYLTYALSVYGIGVRFLLNENIFHTFFILPFSKMRSYSFSDIQS